MAKDMRKSTYWREDLFWLKVSEVSVHGYLVLVVRQNTMARSKWWTKAAHLIVASGVVVVVGLGIR